MKKVEDMEGIYEFEKKIEIDKSLVRPLWQCLYQNSNGREIWERRERERERSEIDEENWGVLGLLL